MKIKYIVFFCAVFFSQYFAQAIKTNFSSTENIASFAAPVKTNLAFQFSSENRTGYSPLNVIGQITGGVAAGVIAALPAAFAYDYKGSGGKISGPNALVLFSSFIAGSTFGIYEIASFENENVSYWDALGFASVSAAIGGAVFIITEGKASYMMIGMPVLGAITYTLFFSEWPNLNVTYSQSIFEPKALSHKDLVNSQTIRFQLVNLNF